MISPKFGIDVSKMQILLLIPSNITNNEVLFFFFLMICLFNFFSGKLKNIKSQKNRHEFYSKLTQNNGYTAFLSLYFNYCLNFFNQLLFSLPWRNSPATRKSVCFWVRLSTDEQLKGKLPNCLPWFLTCHRSEQYLPYKLLTGLY